MTLPSSDVAVMVSWPGDDPSELVTTPPSVVTGGARRKAEGLPLYVPLPTMSPASSIPVASDSTHPELLGIAAFKSIGEMDPAGQMTAWGSPDPSPFAFGARDVPTMAPSLLTASAEL